MWSDLTPIEKQDFWHDLVACGIAGILGLVLLTVFTVLPAEEGRPEIRQKAHLPTKCREFYGTDKWIDCMGVGLK